MNSENIFITEAIDMTHEALAVCKMEDGFTVFVEDLLVGEKAEVLITERKKTFGFGKVLNRITTSDYRVTPLCKDFPRCGGCHLMHMNYDGQLEFKTKRIDSTFNRAGLENVNTNPIIGMDNPYHYRNKADVKFSNSPDGIEVGFYESKTHIVIPLEKCYIIPQDMLEVIQAIKNSSRIHNIDAFDKSHPTGTISTATVRKSSKTGEFSIVLTVNHLYDKEKIADFIVTLIKDIPQIVSIGVRKNKNFQVKNIYGTKGVVDSILDLDFFIGANSFFQVNQIQTEKMYKKIVDYANLKGDEVVVDAYTGIGTIALTLAKNAKKVYGVEMIEDSIKDAQLNAKINNLDNVLFEVGKSEEWLLNNKGLNIDVLIVDPPRKGLDKVLVDTIIEMKIPKVIYASCDPNTLARDLKFLTESNYKIIEVTPFDMFPQTFHVESVTLLKLKSDLK